MLLVSGVWATSPEDGDIESRVFRAGRTLGMSVWGNISKSVRSSKCGFYSAISAL